MKIALRITVAAVVVAMATTAVVGTVHGWPWVDASWVWLDEFVRTPGFGAIAALVAAVVAYRAATLRIRHDRQTDTDKRVAETSSADAGRRWEMLMWVYANRATADPETIAWVCEALAAEAATSLERSLLAVMVESTLELDEEVPDA